MVQPNINFWSISGIESLESQQKHAFRNGSLLTLLCSKDNFNPVYNRKKLNRKRTSLLDRVCFNYEQLFHPVQCTACTKRQCSSRDRRALPEVTGILTISDQVHYL